MNRKHQLQAIRDTAFELCLAEGDAWHMETGIRSEGESVDHENLAGTGFSEDAFRDFAREYLCDEGCVVCTPARTYGFAFDAAAAPNASTTETEQMLKGVGHSFISGNQDAIERLANLVATPAMQYLAELSRDAWVRGDSLSDPMDTLGDWVYVVYEVGLITQDPNLRRFYRLLLPIDGAAVDCEGDVLTSFDGRYLPRADVQKDGVSDVVWTLAQKHRFGVARLGTELALASRIALDHIIETDCLKRVGKGFYGKWLSAEYFDWAKGSELGKACRHALGEDAPDEGTISRWATSGDVSSNGLRGRRRLIHVDSFIEYMKRERKLSEYDAQDILNNVIGCIRSRDR